MGGVDPGSPHSMHTGMPYPTFHYEPRLSDHFKTRTLGTFCALHLTTPGILLHSALITEMRRMCPKMPALRRPAPGLAHTSVSWWSHGVCWDLPATVGSQTLPSALKACFPGLQFRFASLWLFKHAHRSLYQPLAWITFAFIYSRTFPRMPGTSA